MRVDKREFVWEFSQLSCLVKREQEWHKSWWELTSESFLNSHVLVKREQELHESWWELTSESLYESFLNSHVVVKREQELHESWQTRVCKTDFKYRLCSTKKDIPNLLCLKLTGSCSCSKTFSSCLSFPLPARGFFTDDTVLLPYV